MFLALSKRPSGLSIHALAQLLSIVSSVVAHLAIVVVVLLEVRVAFLYERVVDVNVLATPGVDQTHRHRPVLRRRRHVTDIHLATHRLCQRNTILENDNDVLEFYYRHFRYSKKITEKLKKK